jgi:hypothetical protein
MLACPRLVVVPTIMVQAFAVLPDPEPLGGPATRYVQQGQPGQDPIDRQVSG